MSGKKFADALKKFDRDQFYTPTEALGLVKTMASAKFDESIDIALRLGVDPRKADQMVRGTVALPSGTGTDVGRAVGEFKGGKVEYRTDRYGNVHVPLGKASFEPAALEQNFRAVIDELQRAKPASAKGRYLRKITVSSTMGPGVHVDTGRLRPETV